MELDVRNDPARHRYVGDLDGQEAGYLEYVEADGVLDLQHTVVADAFAGQGLAGSLVRQALADIRARGLRIIPTCPYVARYLTKHPEDADLVAS